MYRAKKSSCGMDSEGSMEVWSTWRGFRREMPAPRRKSLMLLVGMFYFSPII